MSPSDRYSAPSSVETPVKDAASLKQFLVTSMSEKRVDSAVYLQMGHECKISDNGFTAQLKACTISLTISEVHHTGAYEVVT